MKLWLFIAVVVLIAAGLPTLAPVINLMRISNVPMGFWLVAVGGPLLLTALTSVLVWRRPHLPLTRWLPMLLAIGGAAIVVSVERIYALGFDGLIVPFGLLAGCSLAIASMAMPGRFGGDAQATDTPVGPAFALAVAILSVALIFVLAAEIRVLAAVLESLTRATGWFSKYVSLIASLLVVVALLFVVGAPRDRASSVALAAAGVGALALLLLAGVLAHLTGYGPLPQIQLGPAIIALADRERGLIENGLSDFAQLKPMASPFLQVSLLDTLGTLAAFALGIAAFVLAQTWPTNVFHSGVRHGARSKWIASASVLGGGLLLTSLAGVVVLARLQLGDAIAAGIPLSNLPDGLRMAYDTGLIQICGVLAPTDYSVACVTEDRVGSVLRLNDIAFQPDRFVVAAPLIAGLPFALTLLFWMGLGFAALAGVLVVLSVLVSRWQLLVARDGEDGSTLSLGVAFCVGLSVLAASIVLALTSNATITALLEYGLAILAAGLFVVGWTMTHPHRDGQRGTETTKSSLPLIAAMITGLGVFFAYVIAVRLFPADVVMLAGLVSESDFENIDTYETFEALRQAVSDATSSADYSAASTALDAYAREILSYSLPRLTTAVLFAVPTAIVVQLIVSRLASGRISTRA